MTDDVSTHLHKLRLRALRLPWDGGEIGSILLPDGYAVVQDPRTRYCVRHEAYFGRKDAADT